jgi:hypothetical protein
LFAVGPDQALRQHQVGQVGFTDFAQDLVGGHAGLQFGLLLVWSVCLVRCVGTCLNVKRIVKT